MITIWSERSRRRPRPARARRARRVLGGCAAALALAVAVSPLAARPAPTARPASRPNILLVVVDTLRADHLESYGWPVPTSPAIARLLSDRGVTVERAHAEAPWTIPSVVSLLAGRTPGDVLRGPIEAFRMPPQGTTLAEALRGLGYATAAFVGNPVIGHVNGFDRGFDTFWPAGAAVSDAWSSGERLDEQAGRWLAARAPDRPFFLYVHFVEPHDPYDSAPRFEANSPFYPRYVGPVDGRWPHGLMLGQLRLPDLDSGVRHLMALYDDQVLDVDGAVERLLASVGDETLQDTLVVFTADHGEELYDHRGWKHGRTLYEEVLRVPLLVRWDRQLPAGAQSDAPARLSDLAPTLVRAAGGTPPREWSGADLMPALRGTGALPARAFYAQHLGAGPRRATAMLGPWKLLLYDRRSRYVPPDRYEAALLRLEGARLPRVALFDLADDPRERSDRAAGHPDVVARLGSLVQERLGHEVPGVRVLLAGAPAGTPVDVELRLAAPVRWDSCFLGEHDAVTVQGGTLRLRLVGEALPKGVLLPPGTRILGVRAPAVAVRLPGGTPYGGGALGAAELAGPWPGGAGGAQLLLWEPTIAAPVGRSDDEERRRLRALGYVG